MPHKPSKTQHGRTTKPGRNNPPTTARPATSTVAELQEQVSALTRELAEARKQLVDALEQQTAASEVLRAISSSAGELEPVFQAMLENATRICGAEFGVLHMAEGEAFRTVALHNAPPGYAESKRRDPMIRYLPKNSALARVKTTLASVQIADVRVEPAYTDATASGNTSRLAFVGLAGVRSLLAVPMLKEGAVIAVIVIYRRHRPGPHNPITRVINTLAVLHIIDYRTDEAYFHHDPLAVAGIELGGIRSLLIVPMVSRRAARGNRNFSPGSPTI